MNYVVKQQPENFTYLGFYEFLNAFFIEIF